MSRETQDPKTGQVAKWWRTPMVWVVLGGPAVVVVASIVTLVLAIRNPDPVLEARPVPSASAEASGAAYLPAVQGRNHAATGDPHGEAGQPKTERK